MQSNKLEMKDFKEFEAYFKKFKEEIQDKFIEQPADGISEDVTKGFRTLWHF
jgi:hypothetical protein